MANDLDLALRVSADIKDAAGNLKRLEGSVKQSGKVVADANAKQARAAQEAARAARDLNEAQRRAARDTGEATSAALKLAQSNDKVARNALKVARAQTSAATATQRAARTARQAAGALDMQATAATRAANANRRLGATSGRARGQIQNVAFQVQDFAVQTAAGTAASVALGQNLPQLLGGFGAWGAVLGAVVAVGLPLASVLFSVGEGAEDAGEATERLAEATERLRSLRDLAGDIEALAERYGKAADQARGLIAAQNALERQDARRAVTALIGSLDEVAGRDTGRVSALEARAEDEALLADIVQRARAALTIDPGDLINPVTDIRSAALAELEAILDPAALKQLADEYGATIEEVLEEIALQLQSGGIEALERGIADIARDTAGALEEIATKFGLLEPAARRVAAAYGDLREASTLEEQADATGRLRAALVATGSASAEQSAEQRAALEAFIRQVLEAENGLLDLVGAGEKVAPGLEGAVLVAEKLADNLRSAADQMNRLKTSAAARLEDAQLRLDLRDDPVELARQQSLARSEREIAPIEAGYRDAGLTPEEIRARTAALREAAAATAEAEAETARLNERLRELGKSDRAGTSGSGRAGQAKKLARELEKAREAAMKLETALGDTLRDYAEDAIETRDEIAEAWGGGVSRAGGCAHAVCHNRQGVVRRSGQCHCCRSRADHHSPKHHRPAGRRAWGHIRVFDLGGPHDIAAPAPLPWRWRSDCPGVRAAWSGTGRSSRHPDGRRSRADLAPVPRDPDGRGWHVRSRPRARYPARGGALSRRRGGPRCCRYSGSARFAGVGYSIHADARRAGRGPGHRFGRPASHRRADRQSRRTATCHRQSGAI